MATNIAGLSAGREVIEAALNAQRREADVNGRLSEVEKPSAGAAAHGGPQFALLPLVDKIAYAFSSGLIVAMRELEGHIAGETQKVNDNVDRRLGELQVSLQELTAALSEQRTLNAAVQEKFRELEASTASLQQASERQGAEINALQAGSEALGTSVSERFELAASTLREAEARHDAQVAALRDEASRTEASLAERLTTETAALRDSGASTAGDLAALRAEVSELTASASERADALAKELMLQQEDFAAFKAALGKLSSSVESFVERLDRQADALRSTFAAYSQRETQLEQLVDGLTRLRALPAPPAASTLAL